MFEKSVEDLALNFLNFDELIGGDWGVACTNTSERFSPAIPQILLDGVRSNGALQVHLPGTTFFINLECEFFLFFLGLNA